MQLHDPTNKKGYNPGTLLVIEKLTGEKDCNGSGAELTVHVLIVRGW